ncbi:MAG: hypothetical protein LBE35_05290 [Clostridiales bacterium]|nr:hypothetical protein [Clostridiales bacterium]
MEYKDLREPNSNEPLPPPPPMPPAPAPRKSNTAVVVLSILSGVLFLGLVAVSLTFAFFATHTVHDFQRGTEMQIVTQIPTRVGNIEAWAEDVVVWAEEFSESMTNWAEDFGNARVTRVGENIEEVLNIAVDTSDNITINLNEANVEILPAENPNQRSIFFISQPRSSFFYDDSSGNPYITELSTLVESEPATLRVYLPHRWQFDHISISTAGEVYIDARLRIDSNEENGTIILTPR